MSMSNLWAHVVCATGIWLIFGIAMFHEHDHEVKSGGLLDGIRNIRGGCCACPAVGHAKVSHEALLAIHPFLVAARLDTEVVGSFEIGGSAFGRNLR